MKILLNRFLDRHKGAKILLNRFLHLDEGMKIVVNRFLYLDIDDACRVVPWRLMVHGLVVN